MESTDRQSDEQKKRGRPPGLPGTARSHRVVTFVTDGELALIQAHAEAADQSLSGTLHELLQSGFERIERVFSS